MQQARYALYYAPAAGSALEDFGARWLGRSVCSGKAVEQLFVPGLSVQDLADLTAEPRRYGFHGTLKPPFALATGTTVAQLEQAVAAFCAGRQSFELPPWSLRWLGSFVALVPAVPCPALQDLAADCVRAFDLFRAPPSDTELAKRRAKGLTPRQEAHLLRWGYPYVMDEFRFHLTLSGSVHNSDQRAALETSLERHTAPLRQQAAPMTEVALYRQEEPQAAFVLHRRFAFGDADAQASL
jgi:putative phosphonate metabolism protein